MATRQRWKVGCAVVSGLGMVLIMFCFLTAAVIQRRVVAPPDMHLAIGSVHLAAYATNRPNCPPYGGRKPPIAAICGSDSIFSSAQVYTVWVFFPGRSGPSGLPRTTFRRLVLLPLD